MFKFELNITYRILCTGVNKFIVSRRKYLETINY